MPNIVFRDETVTEATRWQFWNQSGTMTVNDLTNPQVGQYLETLSRVNTSKFHRRRAEGKLLPLNQYSRISLSSEYVSGSFSAQHKTQPLSHAGYTGKPDITGLGWKLSLTAIDEFLENEDLQFAVQKAAAKFYTNSWDALTFIAELKQLIRMFANLVPTLIGLVRRTPANQFGRKLADLDLQWRYGWRTFFYDLQEIKQLLEGLNKPERKLFKASSAFGSSVPVSTSSQTVNWTTATWAIEYTTSVTLSYKGLVYGTDIPPKILFNPLLTAWEVTRLSFVLDWFISIGQWLAALQFATIHPDHVSAAGYSMTIVKQTVGTPSSTASWTPSGSVNFMSVLDVKARVPMSVPRAPIVKLRLDGWKIVDLLALLLQALTRKGK